MKFAEDPVDRYKRLASAPATTSSAGLTADVLAKVMSDSETVEHPDKLAEHIAQHSRLTVAEAKTAVGGAVSAQGSTELKATAVSQAVATATATATAAATADIELSDPVMLYPWVRLAFALALCCAVGGCIFCIDQLGGRSGVPASALIGLAVIAVLAIIGVLVLVMGYKNVKITGGSGS